MSGAIQSLATAAGQRFLPPDHFGFAERLGWVAVNDTEFHLTAHHLPLTVRIVGGAPHLGALIANGATARPTVDEAGRWRPSYMTIALRTWPFILAAKPAARPIDEIGMLPGSGRIGSRGIAICADPESGQLGPELTSIRNTLVMMRKGSVRLSKALELLSISNVLVPLRDARGAPSGDLTVDPGRFDALEASTLAALAAQSFLPLDLAGALLFSRRHIEAGRLPLPAQVAAAARSSELTEARSDPMDFVLANLETMNFALDGSDLFDVGDFEGLMAEFAPPPISEGAMAAEAGR